MDELLKKLADLDASLDAVLAHDPFTDEHKAEHDRLLAERAKVEAKIKLQEEADQRADQRADLEKKAAARVPAQPKAGENRKTNAATPLQPGRSARTDAEGRVTAFFEETDETVTLRVGEDRTAQTRLSYLDQKKANRRLLKTAGYGPWGEFKNFNEFVRAGLGGTGQQRFDDRVHKHFAVVQGMSEGIGSDGGYTVMPEFASGIIDRVYANNLWSRTDNYTLTGNNMTFLANAETSRANGSRHGGLRGYWLAEGAALTKSKPTFREVTLKLVKLGVLVYLTNELIDDGGAALPTYVRRKAGEEFEFMLGDSLINGTGVGQPLGVLSAPSLVSIAKETGQPASTLVLENLNKMYARFFMPFYGGSYWYGNQDILPELETLTLDIGTGGQAVFMPSRGVAEAPFGTIKSRPLEYTEFNATLGTQGDVILADLGQMLSISKGGVAQAVSMHVEFLTDQLALRFIIRVNSTPWESSAITPFKGSNTQSSFLTLDARA